jgi:hydrogenase maturation protease
MSWPRPIRVIAVGSPLGDDALAWEAARRLREREEFLLDIEVYMVDGGQRLLDLLDGRGTLLLVDAIGPGTGPGTIRRFEWPNQRIEALRPGSTHDLQPAEALRLAAALGIAPPRVVVFGMEAQSIAPGQGLSDAVTAAIPELVRRVIEEAAADPVVEGDAYEPAQDEH